jgi:hypothetical protein
MSELSDAAVVVSLVAAVLLLCSGVQVLQRAGYSAWWVLLLLVPLVNLIAVVGFAFTTWPVERQAEEASLRLRHHEYGAGCGRRRS